MRRLLILALAAALCACATWPPPTGFAPYRGRASRAVSPEGVVYQVRTFDNDPEADLAFWAEALGRRQRNAGYKVIAETPIEGARPGSLLELEAPLGATDYAYLIGIFVDGDDLIVVETAGEVRAVDSRREAVLEALKAIAAGGG